METNNYYFSELLRVKNYEGCSIQQYGSYECDPRIDVLIDDLKIVLPKNTKLREILVIGVKIYDFIEYGLYILNTNNIEYVYFCDQLMGTNAKYRTNNFAKAVIKQVNFFFEECKKLNKIGVFELCALSVFEKKHFDVERIKEYQKQNSYTFKRPLSNFFNEFAKKKHKRKNIKPSVRFDVFIRDKYRCCICGQKANDSLTLEIDHIIPVSKGGTNDINNLQVLCSVCNSGKGDKLI